MARSVLAGQPRSYVEAATVMARWIAHRDAPMRKVMLGLKSGELVAFVEIMPFPDEVMPEVVMWGARCFTRFGPHPDRPEVWVYQEAVVAVSFTPSPGL